MKSLSITQNFFNQYSSTWDSDTEESSLQRTQKIFTELISELEKPVLDLGSGTGVLLPMLEKIENNRNGIIEVDISIKMLKKAMSKSQEKINNNFILADGHKLPFLESKFGSVVCFQVFPHFSNKQKVARELYSLLKKDGKLIILHLMGHKELNKMHFEAGRAVADDRILPAKKLANLLESVGFTITEVEERKNLYLIICNKYI